MGPWRVRDGGFPRLGALASDPPAPALASLELVALVVVIGACVVMQGFTATRGAVKYGGADHASFQRLRRRYNIVYTLGTFGDWIQGAYLYALYREHGFDMADIGYIFVLGYFASATVGTYVASLGDVYGHRRLVMLYGTLYGVACVLMRSSDVTALLASRVLSGVAYSLLFSSFESWAISEVDRLRLDRRYLVPLFSTATFFNAVSAVAAGVVGNLAVEYFQPASTQALDVAGRGVVGSNPTDDFATHGHGHRRHALFAFASDAERPAGTLLAPTNKYVPAFDIGAGGVATVRARRPVVVGGATTGRARGHARRGRARRGVRHGGHRGRAVADAAGKPGRIRGGTRGCARRANGGGEPGAPRTRGGELAVRGGATRVRVRVDPGAGATGTRLGRRGSGRRARWGFGRARGGTGAR